MSRVILENQKQLTGKCVTCLGCNRLEISDFEGVEECKNYAKRQERRKRLDIGNYKQLNTRQADEDLKQTRIQQRRRNK